MSGRAQELRGLPLLGILPALWRDPLKAIADIGREHGDVVRVRLFNTAYFLYHPDHAKQVLLDRQTKYTRSFIHRFFEPIGGKGLLTSEGEPWLRQRRLEQPAFNRERVTRAVPVMTQHIGLLMDRWEGVARKGEVLEVIREMLGLTLTTAGKTLFGADFSSDVDRLGRVIRVILNTVSERVANYLPVALTIPTPGYFRFRRAMRELNEVVQELITSKRSSGEEATDVLAMMVAARDVQSGEGMTDRQLRDEILTLLIASHETTSVALAWTFYLLAQHPDVDQRLHEEVSHVLGGRVPAAADLPRLRYVSQVIQEALRLYPPGFMLSRRLLEDDDLGGYVLPAGATVFCFPYLLHRHPTVWERPDVFDPERFTPERSAGLHRGAYLPFGAGLRQCIGNHFAAMQMALIVAMVAQRFRVALAPGYVLEQEAALTLRPRNGVRVTLTPRAPRS